MKANQKILDSIPDGTCFMHVLLIVNMPKAIAGENDVPPASELQSLNDMGGKICVVTGGGSGIGAMISAGFVARCHRI